MPLGLLHAAEVRHLTADLLVMTSRGYLCDADALSDHFAVRLSVANVSSAFLRAAS